MTSPIHYDLPDQEGEPDVRAQVEESDGVAQVSVIQSGQVVLRFNSTSRERAIDEACQFVSSTMAGLRARHDAEAALLYRSARDHYFALCQLERMVEAANFTKSVTE